MRAGRQ